MNDLKIIGLKISGVRKINAIEMSFTKSGLIPIVGKNEMGKTTVLDSIEMLLRGGAVVPNGIISHGADKALISATVGKYKIKRTITEKTNRLEISTDDGFHLKVKPQAFLDSLINDLTFSPMPFLTKSSKQKQLFLMDLLKINVDDINEKIQECDVSIKTYRRMIKEIGSIEHIEKVEKIDVDDLYKKIEDLQQMHKKKLDNFNLKWKEEFLKIEKFNKEQDDIENNEFEIVFKIDTLEKEISEHENELLIIGEKILEKKAKIKTLNDKKRSIPKPKKKKEINEIKLNKPIEPKEEIKKIKEDIKKANENNLKYINYIRELEKIEKLKKYNQILDNEKQKKTSLQNEKINKFKCSKLPIKGLQIREHDIFYNGISSDNWSRATAISVSLAVCLSMNPKLKAIFIDGGESFDYDYLKYLSEWAKSNDIQCFITIVRDDDKIDIVDDVFFIEDGTIIN